MLPCVNASLQEGGVSGFGLKKLVPLHLPCSPGRAVPCSGLEHIKQFVEGKKGSSPARFFKLIFSVSTSLEDITGTKRTILLLELAARSDPSYSAFIWFKQCCRAPRLYSSRRQLWGPCGVTSQSSTQSANSTART